MSNKELIKRIKKRKRKNKKKVYRDIKLRKLQQILMKYISKLNQKIECCIFCGDKGNIERFYTLQVFFCDYYICYDCYQNID